VAVVLTLIQTKQIRINTHKRNNTKCTVQTIQNTEIQIGKAIPLQASTGPEGSRRLRLPDFMTIGT
jgi:hypothetical protein